MRALALLLGFTMSIATASTVSAQDSADDPFAEGSVWVGEAKLAKKDSDVAKWAMTVTARNGTRFEGEILIKPPKGDLETLKVIGTATNKDSGILAFKTEAKGFAQINFRGKLQNGEAGIIFYGTGKLGRAGAGTATLKPKN